MRDKSQKQHESEQAVEQTQEASADDSIVGCGVTGSQRGLAAASGAPGRNAENRALTGLRGIAAMAVVFGHYELTVLGGVDRGLNKYLGWGNAAVDLFFCLSGYTLSKVYLGPDARFDAPLGAWRYLVSRVARILPLSVAVTMLTAFFLVRPNTAAFAQNPSRVWTDAWLQGLGLNAWPVVGDGRHWNTPAWSISVEVFCYLFIFPLFAWRRPAISTAAAVSIMVLTMASSVYVYAHYFDWRWISAVQKGTFDWTNRVAPLVRSALGFACGYAVFVCDRDHNAVWRAVAHRTGDMIVCLFVLLLALSASGHANAQYGVLLFPFLILSLTSDQSITARVLASRPLHALGLWSYSIYLCHVPLRWAMDAYLWSRVSAHTHVPVQTRDIVGLMLLIALSAASWRWFEMPCRQTINWLLGGRVARKSVGFSFIR